jgi:flavin reductase (DIM6/NTAB) family NADH-FMN oxidoreductase RutF
MDVASSVDAAAFRRLMARWATGVSVLTARDRDVDGGLTVNAFLSLSLNPPAVLVSLMRDVDTLPLVERSRRFGVSFLAADQRPLSERFARMIPAAEKFRGVAFHRGPSGLALLDGTLGALECRVASLTPTYDHVLAVGEVVHQELGRDTPPLVFYRSTYAETEGPDRLRFPSAGP